MTATIEDFRRELRSAIETHNRIVSYLEDGHLIRPLRQDPEQASAAWLEKLRQQRAELDDVLAQLPSE